MHSGIILLAFPVAPANLFPVSRRVSSPRLVARRWAGMNDTLRGRQMLERDSHPRSSPRRIASCPWISSSRIFSPHSFSFCLIVCMLVQGVDTWQEGLCPPSRYSLPGPFPWRLLGVELLPFLSDCPTFSLFPHNKVVFSIKSLDGIIVSPPPLSLVYCVLCRVEWWALGMMCIQSLASHGSSFAFFFLWRPPLSSPWSFSLPYIPFPSSR